MTHAVYRRWLTIVALTLGTGPLATTADALPGAQAPGGPESRMVERNLQLAEVSTRGQTERGLVERGGQRERNMNFEGRGKSSDLPTGEEKGFNPQPDPPGKGLRAKGGGKAGTVMISEENEKVKKSGRRGDGGIIIIGGKNKGSTVAISEENEKSKKKGGYKRGVILEDKHKPK